MHDGRIIEMDFWRIVMVVAAICVGIFVALKVIAIAFWLIKTAIVLAIVAGIVYFVVQMLSKKKSAY